MLLKHGPHQWTWASVLFHFFIVVVSLYSTLVWRFLCREKLKWNEAYPYKCVAVCMMMLLTFWLATSCVLANIMTECKILVCLFYTNLYPQSWADEFSGSHAGLSMLFMMKVMVQHCVSSCHKVMTALNAMLPSKCCCGDFSTIL
jgi:hypothetical protein